MMHWLKKRFWIGASPFSDMYTVKYLVCMGLITETPLEDASGWEMRITDYGNQFFERLSVLTRVRTFIRCQLESDATLLMKQSLSPDQLPEFVVHPEQLIREAALAILESCNE